MTKEQTNSWELELELEFGRKIAFANDCIPLDEPEVSMYDLKQFISKLISQEREKWLQIIETKREECKKYPLKSMNGSITDKTANDMVDVALLDIINLIQKQ